MSLSIITKDEDSKQEAHRAFPTRKSDCLSSSFPDPEPCGEIKKTSVSIFCKLLLLMVDQDVVMEGIRSRKVACEENLLCYPTSGDEERVEIQRRRH